MKESERPNTIRGHLKSIKNLIITYWKHDTDPATLIHARKVTLTEWSYIQSNIEHGVFTQKQLDEISNDDSSIRLFEQIMTKARSAEKTGYEEAQAAVYELTPEQLGAFFIFKLNFLEKRFNIKLISREEDYAGYDLDTRI